MSNNNVSRIQQNVHKSVISSVATAVPIKIFEQRYFDDECLTTATPGVENDANGIKFGGVGNSLQTNYDLQSASKNAMLRPSTLASSLSKNLYSAPSLGQYFDANSFADVLGVSPAFRQKETIRWNSALQVYKQMSCHDLASLAAENDAANDGVDETSSSSMLSTSANLFINNFNDGVPYVNPMISGNFHTNPSSTLLSPDASATTAALVENHFAGALSSFMSLPSRRCGFLTPPLRQNQSLANDLLMKRQEHLRSGSHVSPGESSLNSLELEAIAAVHELQFAVKDIFVSELLPRTSELIFLNVTTLEGQPYCVELTMKGWRVTSMRHDCMNGDIRYIDLHVKFFETIYALMDNISPGYRDRFSEALSAKLNILLDNEKIATAAAASLANGKRIINVSEIENDIYGDPIIF